MKHCESCGAPIEGNEQTCPYCAAPIKGTKYKESTIRQSNSEPYRSTSQTDNTSYATKNTATIQGGLIGFILVLFLQLVGLIIALILGDDACKKGAIVTFVVIIVAYLLFFIPFFIFFSLNLAGSM